MSFPISLPAVIAAPSALLAKLVPPGECPEHWYCHHPEVLSQAFTTAKACGASLLLAPTSGGNAAALSAFGLENSMKELNLELMRLCKQAAEPLGLPVGGMLGSTDRFVPPLGEEDFDDIYELYRAQVHELVKAGADFLFLSGHQCLSDLRAAMLAAKRKKLPVLATLTVDSSGKTLSGGTLLPAVIVLQAMGADAVGLEGNLHPEKMQELLEEVLPHASIPLIALPEAEDEDGVPLPPDAFAEKCSRMLDAGIPLIGGVHLTDKQMAAVGKLDLNRPIPGDFYEDADNYAAAIESEAFFLGEDIIYSEPMDCDGGLAEDLIDIDDEIANATLVRIETPDDAQWLAKEAAMTRQPIAVQTNSLPVLEAALRYFPGRLIIDSDCELDEEVLSPLAAKYGAILY